MDVKFYSGYKGEEKPISFELDGKTHRVVELIETKIAEDYRTKKRSKVYLVKSEDGNIYEIKYKENKDLSIRMLNQT